MQKLPVRFDVTDSEGDETPALGVEGDAPGHEAKLYSVGESSSLLMV